MKAALAALREDPRIAGAAVAPATGDPDARASVLILPDRQWLEFEMQAAGKASERTLRGWETTYDLAYRRPEVATGPNFDGWNSSFTRNPIPLSDMRDWLDAITGRILALPHGRVREIGCGTGLLVETVAPHCSFYEAADFSAVAIARLQDWLAGRPDLAHVRALRQAAHQDGDAADPVDLVIINSVAQHFPDAAYLRTVLQTAWRGLAAGGHIIVGDVRLLGLQPVFIAAVELARAPDDMRVGALRQAIHAAWLSQSELLIDPGFFHRFAHAQGGSVSVRLKSGRRSCEMTRYRCDVVLAKPGRPAAEPQKSRAAEPQSFAAAELQSMAALRAWLARAPAGGAVLRGLANARLARDRSAHRMIARSDPMLHVGALKAALDDVQDGGVDPADIETLAAEHGRSCALLAPPGAQGSGFDAWFGDLAGASGTIFAQPAMDGSGDEVDLTSRPLMMHALRRLITSLHGTLSSRLEEAEMPERILPVLHAKDLSSTDP